MKNLLPLSLLLLVLVASAPLQGQDIVFLETFEDDTVGGPPGTPDVGTANYYGTLPRTVIDEFGGKRLRCVDAVTDDGFANQWWPTASPTMFEISYLFRLESAAGAGDLTVQYATLTTADSTGSITLDWQPGGGWEVSGNIPASTYSLDTDYEMVWQVDCSTDRVSISANGTPLFTDLEIGFDCTGLVFFVQSSTINTTTSEVIDDVKIISGHTVFSDGFESGDTSLWSSTEPPPPQPGDSCADPVVLFDGIPFIGDLVDNTPQGSGDSCSGGFVDEWLAYTAPYDGEVIVSTCHPSTLFDTVIAVFEPCDVFELTCNDQNPSVPGCNPNDSWLSFAAVAGIEYYLRVSAWNDELIGSLYEIRADCTPGPPAR